MSGRIRAKTILRTVRVAMITINVLALSLFIYE